MGRRVLFLGPPGAGKGTQAKMLARAVGVPHVSTGEMLRDAVARGTELGRKAASIMATGDLVPDELVVAIVEERLAADDAACGYLLDGFPRNVEQAEALAAAIGDDAIDTTISIDVPEEEIVARLLNRARLEGRSDDNEETIRRRLDVYRDETEPLLGHYRETLISVDGIGTVDDVFARIALALAES
jgi:adenylate kinase